MTKLNKLNEKVTFKFYTFGEAQRFYTNRIEIHGNTANELKIYIVKGFGWAVEVMM